MSKNLTRKGLALGAGLSLVATGFVALPANASGIDNGFVSLAPTSGTAYRVLADGTFDLKANAVSSIAISGKNLKFLVQDPTSRTKADWGTATTASESYSAAVASGANKLSSVVVSGTNLVTATITSPTLDSGDKIVGHSASDATAAPLINGKVFTHASGTTATYSGTGLTDATLTITGAIAEDTIGLNSRAAILAAAPGDVFQGTAVMQATIGGVAVDATSKRLADGSYVVDTKTHDNANDRILRLVNTDATKTTAVTVTAWVDDNDNGVIDTTEYRSPAREVSFHINSDLTVVSAIDQPVVDATTITGTVNVTPELNGQQVGNTAVTAAFTVQTGSGTAAASYNSTSKVWDITFTYGGSDKVVVGNYTMRASVATAAIGNTASASVGARVAADTRIVIAGTNDTSYLRNVDATATDDSANTSLVRPTKAATLVVTAFDSLGNPVSAGKSVTVDLTTATTGVNWSVNDVTFLGTGHAGSGSKVYTTDAKGQVTLTVKSATGLNGHSVLVTVKPENLTGTAAARVRLSYQTATYAIVDLNAPVNGSARNVVKGGSVTYNLAAVDQWNAKLTGAYRLYMTNSGRTSSAANVDFANGVATWTVQDAQLGSGSTITVAAQLQKQTSGVWANSSDATAWGGSTITAIDAPVTAIVPTRTYSSGTFYDLSEYAIANYHHKTFQGSYDFPDDANNAGATASLSLNVGISAGDTVTVSGTDLSFAYVDETGTDTILAVGVGTLTFVVDNTADYIQVHSNKIVKDAVVTMTANGRSGTVLVTSGKPGQDTATSFDLSGTPASAAPGSTFQVVVTLKDDFGNPVDTTTANRARVTYTGPGIVFGQLPTETDANGQMKFAVLLGTNDRGTATVMAFYDLGTPDGDSTDLYEFSTSKSVTVGAVAGAQSTSVKRTGNTVAVRVTGYAKSRIVLNGVRVASRSTLGTLSRTLTLRAGRNVIQIVVDGTVIRTVRYTR